jgi:hypothetical protein
MPRSSSPRDERYQIPDLLEATTAIAQRFLTGIGERPV